MLFNSPTFVIFFILVFSLYWLLRDRGRQNVLLLLASYVFYGMWSWKFLLLLMATTTVDYLCGMRIQANTDQKKRRFWMLLCVGCNLTVLATFKYLGFFLHETAALLEGFGLHANIPLLQILLPVGISFYTFQSIGYVIDVYRGKVTAVRDLSLYALYVSFFPQLVAGPIERAGHMLPQYTRDRQWNAAAFESGLLLMVWGLFKKVVIADNLAPYVDAVFKQPGNYSGTAIATAVVFFAFQIYCDFSGYTDTARGTARTLGFELTRNFNFPYLSRTPVEFWRRWHMSLSQWFQDYLYFPLAMHYMRVGGWASKYKAHIVAMTLIGFWHGANWTFILFGLYWGVAIAAYLYFVEFLAERPQGSVLTTIGSALKPIGGALSIAVMFVLVCFGWILFRADNLAVAGDVIGRLFATTGASSVVRLNVTDAPILWALIAGLLIIEWLHRRSRLVLDVVSKPGPAAYALRAGMLVAILFCYLSAQEGASRPFIYFQF